MSYLSVGVGGGHYSRQKEQQRGWSNKKMRSIFSAELSCEKIQQGLLTQELGLHPKNKGKPLECFKQGTGTI